MYGCVDINNTGHWLFFSCIKKRAEAAQTLKAKGNSLFTSKNYEEAVRLYTQAIRFKADSIFFANRAACFANLGKHDNVIEDCNAALKLDPVYVKALNRRALAFEKKGEFVNSLYGTMMRYGMMMGVTRMLIRTF